MPVALEISRSGNGAHAWIFFTTAVPARDARRLGTAIISHTCNRSRQLSLSSSATRANVCTYRVPCLPVSPASVDAYSRKLGAGTRAAQCPGCCIDPDGEKVSRYAGEAQRVGQPGSMNRRSRAKDHVWQQRQAPLAISSSQFLIRIAWRYWWGYFESFAFYAFDLQSNMIVAASTKFFI